MDIIFRQKFLTSIGFLRNDCLKGFQNFLVVVFRRDLLKNSSDLAILADHKRCARNSHIFPAVHIFLNPDAVIPAGFLLFIGQKKEGQVKLFNKFLPTR